jgi:hypothetical protein
VFGQPEVRIIEFAPPDGIEPQAPRLAVFADPWPGVIAVWSAAAGGGFHLAATLTAPATIGKLLAPLAPGPLDLFDRANAVEVELFGGALSSLPEVDILGGRNAAAVKTASGGWEILQFAAAELIGPDTYRLTRLLRGECGSEQAMVTGAAAGADFVLLDAAVVPVPTDLNELGVVRRVRFGPAQDDHAAPSFIEIAVTASGIGLKPFAPVHLKARKDLGSGDIALTWIRRTRFGGVSWELAETPLNEEREAYRLEVYDGGDLLRTVETSAPAYVYAAADQIADFGAPPSEFTLRVAQLSAIAGPGFALQESLHV